jgi:hypothetical protein
MKASGRWLLQFKNGAKFLLYFFSDYSFLFL